MRKMASIGFAIAVLTVTALPVHADDQSIGFATGAIGGTPLPLQADEQQPQTTSRQRSADWRAAPDDIEGGAGGHLCWLKGSLRPSAVGTEEREDKNQ